MSRLEPRGWQDMTMDKRMGIVSNLASVGLVDLGTVESSLSLVQRGMQEKPGSFEQVKILKSLEARGAGEVIPALSSWDQAQFLDRVFDKAVINELFGAKAPSKIKAREHGAEGLSI